MSFHQHYEFLTIDRPLRADELAEVRKISSHASVSSTRFAVSYDWGDLRGDPADMLLRWFDVYLYRSSNSAQFMLKVPSSLLDSAAVDAFTIDDFQEFDLHGEHIVISWRLEDDDGGGWIEDEAVASEASELGAIRAALLRGDLWPLYVGWLATRHGADEDELEPPVPRGLVATDPACLALAGFLGVSQDLLAAAAQASDPVDPRAEKQQLLTWLATQPTADKDAALASWLREGEGEALPILRARFAGWRKTQLAPTQNPCRTVAELRACAKVIAETRKRLEAERKACERAAHLDAVAGAAKTLWADVPRLAEDRSRAAPQLLVDRLRDLRDAADKHGTRLDYDKRLAGFVTGLSPTRKLYQLLAAAGLLGKR